MESKAKYKVIGLMSGTSLDGLDIAYCSFKKAEKGWEYSIEQAEMLRYPSTWMKSLSTAHEFSGKNLVELDVNYGKYLGTVCRDFIDRHKCKPDFIASHGHTVFHQPEKGFTFQIGNGNALHSITGLPVVFDFRSLDVFRGGQGAPLVPAGDKFLFSDYDVCLNLGGIANISTDVNKSRIAFDVCFSNMGLNYLMAKVKKPYDKNGQMSADGEIDKGLLKSLDKVYASLRKKRPSLGREGFQSQIKPLLDQEKIPLKNRLRTFTESAAKEIVAAIAERKKNPKVLCTGGGAFNSFLVSRMLDLAADQATFMIPDEEIVKFKEAMVFAFLGVLRVRDEVNCLKSVTGATRDSSSGVLAGF
jgi:anhydro-N-acetylmuramic acid kinase